MDRIAELKKHLVAEKAWDDRVQKSLEMQAKNEITNRLIEYLKSINEINDIKTIINVEKEILTNELEEYANSNLNISSLTNAINEMDIVLEQLDVLSNHESYALSARNFNLNKNRRNGLPLDEGRQVFASHMTRLDGFDKARGSKLDKEVLNERKKLWRKARSLYIAMQKDFVNSVNNNDLMHDFSNLLGTKTSNETTNQKMATVNTNSTAYKKLIGEKDNTSETDNVQNKPIPKMRN